MLSYSFFLNFILILLLLSNAAAASVSNENYFSTMSTSLTIDWFIYNRSDFLTAHFWSRDIETMVKKIWIIL